MNWMNRGLADNIVMSLFHGRAKDVIYPVCKHRRFKNDDNKKNSRQVTLMID
jgi:hypothetical protein